MRGLRSKRWGNARAGSSRALLAALVLLPWGAKAGELPAHPHPLVTQAEQHDTSPPLRNMAPLPASVGPSVREIPREPRPTHRGPRAPHEPKQPLDPVVQDSSGTSSMPAPDGSFDGLGNVDGVLPPDPAGAVGPDHYVQWINTSFAVYDKAGNLLYGPAAGNTLWSGFGGPCETSNDGDPIVLHDHLADRWFMSQLALPDYPFGPFYQCIAVSQTADPTGPFYRYAFRISDTKLNDYPKFGVWPDAYYLAVNQFNEVTLSYGGQGVVAFERERMLAGQPAAMVYFDLFGVDPNLGGMLPADLDGPAPPPGSPAYFVQFDDDAWGYAPQDQLQLWQFHVDWSDPQASTFTGPAVLPAAPFDSNLCGYNQNCIPQLGTSRKVDAISDRLMYRLQYRNFGTHESLVVNHTVDAGGDHAGIRWYEIRDPGGTPVVYQQSTYAPDADHRWMGSVAMDGAGDLALGFSVSSATRFPSVGYAGRLASDPLGTLAQDEVALAVGSGSQTDPSGRWGDYSTLTVDPTDHCTFWYTQEYYAATSAIGWHTRIGSFRFPSCTSDLPSVTANATAPTTPEAGPTPGVVTFSRAGSTEAPLTVHYTIGGTATAGADYAPLSGSVTIEAGAVAATVEVTPIDDAVIESDESVSLTIAADSAYMPGTPSSAIVTIINDDFPPDLVVSAVSAPSAAGAGETLTVSDTTKNQGAGAAGASTTAFYLSTNTSLDAGDTLLGGRPVSALAVGAASIGTTAITIPAATTAGAYYLIAKADAGEVVAESQEGNNMRARSITIGPDLVVSALTAPGATAAGATISVSDTTKNQGAGAAGASTTAFYLSTNATLDADDTLIGSRPVPSLTAGAASTWTGSLSIPAGAAAGAYYLIAKADGDDTLGETVEGNNTRARSIQIGADLVVSALTAAPSTAAAGATLSVSDTTKNQGAGAAGASTTAIFFSTDKYLDAGDTPLASRPVPALEPGVASTATTAVTIPVTAAPGLYYLIGKADADGVVAESLDGNNTAWRAIPIGPDLVIAVFTVPAGGAAGGTIKVSDTTKNSGGDTAGPSTTRFSLSTDATTSAGDVVLGSRLVPALAPNTSSAASTDLVIPSGTAPGAYFVLAKADAGAVVAESQETNNTASGTITIGADLVVSSLSAPTSGAAGGTITVSDTTKNSGGDAAGPSVTGFYLSTNTSLGATDTLLGSRPVPPLAPGASSVASTALTIPTATPPGTYYILARADDGLIVLEARETNNLRSDSIQVTAAP